MEVLNYIKRLYSFSNVCIDYTKVIKLDVIIDPVEVVGQWYNWWVSNWSDLTQYILKNSKLYMYLLYISI